MVAETVAGAGKLDVVVRAARNLHSAENEIRFLARSLARRWLTEGGNDDVGQPIAVEVLYGDGMQVWCRLRQCWGDEKIGRGGDIGEASGGSGPPEGKKPIRITMVTTMSSSKSFSFLA